MIACDGTSAVAPRAKKHMILLAGVFAIGGQMVLARASLQQTSEGGGVRMKVCLFFIFFVVVVVFWFFAFSLVCESKCCEVLEKRHRYLNLCSFFFSLSFFFLGVCGTDWGTMWGWRCGRTCHVMHCLKSVFFHFFLFHGEETCFEELVGRRKNIIIINNINQYATITPEKYIIY